MITRDIRLHLYKDVPKNEKDEFSSKHLRIEPITKMEAHRGVNFFGIHACVGHSLGTNQERHMEKNIIALTLKGAYALNGWVDATPNKLHPTFHLLGPHLMEQSNFLIKKLYIVSV